MKKPKVFIAADLPRDVLDYLGQHLDYRVYEGEGRATYEDVLENVKDAEGLLLALIDIDENLLDHAPNLRVVSNFSVGYNNFDLEIMKERNIIGTHTAGSLDSAVSDLIMGLILATGRRISELDRYVKNRKWTVAHGSFTLGKDVSGASLGIIGMGRIGQMVARKAKYGFDMEINYHNRSRKEDIEEELGAKYLSFDDLLRESDYVVVMTPLTDETYHLIGEREFKLMKEDGIFINTSRGPVVDEEALIKALKEGQILRAGLDVFEKEPLDLDSPLLDMDNVITLPHMAASTRNTLRKMARMSAENLVKALITDQPENVVPELR